LQANVCVVSEAPDAHVSSIAETVEQASACLRTAAVPDTIVAVARRLQAKAHAAVLVGGAVRDALLGLPASDWDLATSATPQEVQAVFRHTIPTGIEHGTVTVMVRRHGVGSDEAPVPVEVTTFRGEGAYVDGRRPSSVTFHRDLREDLARRDFTVNAFAWDPIAEVFSDPFDGLADLRRGTIRAVGDPAARFREDGLRTMRAVRLCATRGFALAPDTAAAIAPALPVLDQVSRERVYVELRKLLVAPKPSLGLEPMLSTGMWPHVLPSLPPAEARKAIVAVDGFPRDFELRLARLIRPLAVQGAAQRARALEVVDHRLRLSRAERARLVALTSEAVDALGRAVTPAEIRRGAATLGKAHVRCAVAVAELDAEHAARIETALEGAALEVADLEVRGRDLIAAGLVEPGPIVGRVLVALLERTFEDPTLNEKARLLALASEVVQELRASTDSEVSGPRGGGAG
jgi:tRNA nucleotidyltransferase (CCA-adding enzyme)